MYRHRTTAMDMFADPGRFFPDPTLEKRLYPDPTFKPTDSDPTLEKHPRILPNFDLKKHTFFFISFVIKFNKIDISIPYYLKQSNI